MDKIEQAYLEWRKLQDRETHPQGTFDRAGRWYPSDEEEQPCCGNIRQPSRDWPYSLLKHCRSVEHVARRHGVSSRDLRSRIARDRREGGENYYKVVASGEGGRLFSIFDGQTEYALGVTLTQQARQNHNGGFYVYDSPAAARAARFPADSALKDGARVLLRVKAEGTYCRYDNGKLAFSRVTPLEIVDQE